MYLDKWYQKVAYVIGWIMIILWLIIFVAGLVLAVIGGAN